MRKVLILVLLSVSLAMPASAATCNDKAYHIFIECLKIANQFLTIERDPDLLKLYSAGELKALIKASEECQEVFPKGKEDRRQACTHRMFRQYIPDELIPHDAR